MLDGLKTKLSAIGLVLTGLGTVLAAVTAEGGFSLESAREGLLLALGGLATLGIGHKLEKLLTALKGL